MDGGDDLSLLVLRHGVAASQDFQGAECVQGGRQARQAGALQVLAAPQGFGQLLLGSVQPHPPVLDGHHGVGEDVGGAQTLQLLAGALELSQHGLPAALPQLIYILFQLQLVGYRQLCPVGWGGGTEVGHIINDGHVRFMPHSGDHRNIRFIHRTGKIFIVKRPQILHRTAASADDDQIRHLLPVGVAQGAGQLCRRTSALHPHRQELYRGHGPAGVQDAGHVVDGGTSLGGDEGDALWVAWDGLFMLGGKETLLVQLVLQLLEGHIQFSHFPTGGVILGTAGINEAYRTGRGKIRVRAVTDIEPMDNGKNRIVVTELPYLVNKARLIEKIAELHKDKRIDGITDLRDESDREGMRIVIELRRDVNPSVVLNLLYKHTQMQDTFGVINLALVDNQPKILNLYELLNYYLIHQKEVITRRTRFDLNKAEERAHILQGLIIALDNIDEVISIIRGSRTTADAKNSLMERFGLSDAQAQAIVDMRLKTLTGLEREKLENEYKDLMAQITELKAILADEKKLLAVIRTEILEIADKYGDDRRTQIGYDEFDISMEDLIPETNTVITMTKVGYIKRMGTDNFKSQHRGGKGIKGMETIQDDYIVEMLMTTSHHYLMFFTNMGRVYRIKAYEIPEASRTSRGTAIINIIPLQPDEKITAMIPIKDYEKDKYLFMATKNGIVKKTSVLDYENIRKTGLAAISLRDDDELIEVKITGDDEEILLFTRYGQCIRFKEADVRATGRTTMGVIGMNLTAGDEVIAMQMASQGESVMIVSEKGLGKCTRINEFTTQNRGGKGVKCYKITEKSGNLIGVKSVVKDDELMLITTEGIIIRIRVNDTALLGRVTSGVKLIDLKSGVTVASIARVVEDKSLMPPEEEATEENETEGDPS